MTVSETYRARLVKKFLTHAKAKFGNAFEYPDIATSYVNNNTKITIKHLECGTVYTARPQNHLQTPGGSCHTCKANNASLFKRTTRYGLQVTHKVAVSKDRAQKRGLDWELSQSTAEDLLVSDCHYCGTPSQNVGHKNRASTQYAGMNGIDRVDNSLGYVDGNCVSCCRTCNVAKGTMTTEEFRAWVQRIYNHMFGVKP